jgi:DNA modification methylase
VTARVLTGDVRAVLATLPAGSARVCVTSPPYWGLRDYGVDGQLGLEPTPAEYVTNMVDVFREVRRVLADDGTCWVNLGDSYNSSPSNQHSTVVGANGSKALGATVGRQVRDVPGLKPKDLVGIPWRVAFALQADGWYLRSDIIWSKPNPMPESVTDRPTKAHEYLFLLSKRDRYYYDADAIREPHAHPDVDHISQARTAAHAVAFLGNPPTNIGRAGNHPLGRNRRTVWTIATEPFPGAHFATYPTALVEPCILAGSARGDTVLDPFAGSGTTGLVALRHGRRFVGIELNAKYAEMARRRIKDDCPLLNEVA